MVDSGWKWLEDTNLSNFSIMENCQIQFGLDSTLMNPYLCCNNPETDPIFPISGKSFLSSLPCTFHAVVAGETKVQERAERLNDLWRCQKMPGDVDMCQPMSGDVRICKEMSAYISISQEMSCIIVIFIITGILIVQPVPLLAFPQRLPHAQAGTQVERNIHGSRDFWADWEIKSKMKKDMEQTDRQ